MKDEQTKPKIAPVGGQAVMEGVMMRGSNAMALAVRDPEGVIRVETYRLSGSKWYKKIPIIRGIVSFASSLVVGMKMLTRSVEISSPEDESVGKGGMAIAMLLGILFAVGLFIVIPELISGFIRDYLLEDFAVSTQVLLHSLIGGVLRIIIFILYLVLCSKMKDIRRTFMYHGAEHKTINCYENGVPLTVENIQKFSCVHRRCGTTFLFLVMMVSILLFALANWLFEVWGLWLPSNKILQTLVKMGIKLALLPLVAGLAFEVLKLFAKLPYNLFTKIIMAPGLLLQKLSTNEPDDAMVEVALKSFNASMEMEHNPDIDEIRFPDQRYSDVLQYIKEMLRTIEADEAEAYWILCHITGLSRNALHQIKVVSDADYKKIQEIITKRLEREPLDYIFGCSEFYGQRVEVSKDVLIPRMDTETLCETAIKTINRFESSKAGDGLVRKNNDSRCKVLDLCTGSGCVALAISKNTNAQITASDISEAALAVAARNLEGTGCKILQGDMFENVTQKFDVIVSNPPYIKSGDISGLQAEVVCQPKLALDGGIDGLEFYRKIIELAPKYLNPCGNLILEIGYDQADAVSKLLSGSFEDVTIIKDLSGNDRVLSAVACG